MQCVKQNHESIQYKKEVNITMKTKNYVIYARASGDVEKQNWSIKSQVKTLEEYAKKNSFSVVRVYEEIGSANTKERPCFDLLIKSIKQGEVNGILCMGVDRLARNLKFSMEIYSLILRKKIEIITPYISITDKNEVVAQLLVCSMNHMESLARSERMKKTIALNRKKSVCYLRVSSKSQESKEGGE